MSLTPLAPVDTRPLFRPVSSALTALLRSLPSEAWQRPTIAGAWTVRDVVAHLTDIALRRLSFGRDALVPPPPPFPIGGERDFVRFINGLNGDWVAAMRRLSPRVLADLFELASSDLADFLESSPLDREGLFGVSWAGEAESPAWLDVGREFAELWHHQAQIRLAVEAPPLEGEYLAAALDIAARALPHALRNAPAPEGTTIAVEVDGELRRRWAVVRAGEQWLLRSGSPSVPAARLQLTADAAWRLFFNALPREQGAIGIRSHGQPDLIASVLRARAIVV